MKSPMTDEKWKKHTIRFYALMALYTLAFLTNIFVLYKLLIN